MEKLSNLEIVCDTVDTVMRTRFFPLAVRTTSHSKLVSEASPIHQTVCARYSFRESLQSGLSHGVSWRREIVSMDSTIAKRSDRKDVGYFSAKEHNPLAIVFINRLQGLRHELVNCTYQDVQGNLWIASRGSVSVFDGKSMLHYSKAEGFHCDEVLDITQDQSGNMWFGTNQGPIMFDGIYFKRFSKNTEIDKSAVHSLLVSKDGKIWFAMQSGVACYDGQDIEYITNQEIVADVPCKDLLEDAQNRIWIATLGNGCFVISDSSLLQISSSQGLLDDNVRCLMKDHQNNIWIGTSKGINVLSGEVMSRISEPEGLPVLSVVALAESRNGEIWIGTFQQALFKMDAIGLHKYTKEDGLSDANIKSILEDSQGNMWFSSLSGGVNRYSNGLINHYTIKEGISNNRVYCFHEDSIGRVWIGTESGINILSGDSLVNISIGEDASLNYISSMVSDNHHGIWIGTHAGAILYSEGMYTLLDKRLGLCDDWITSVICDRRGDTWFGTVDGVSRFDGLRVIIYHFCASDNAGLILDIHEDVNGNVWFCTDEALYHFNGESFSRLAVANPDLLKRVYCIEEDGQGVLWLGTLGNGLFRYDGASLVNYSERSGVANPYVVSMWESNGDLWLGTRGGILYADIKELNQGQYNHEESENSLIAKDVQACFSSLNFSDGLMGIGVLHGSMMLDSKQRLWFGAPDRLTMIDTRKIAWNGVIPKIQLGGLDLFNESMNWHMLQQHPDTSFLLGNNVMVSNVKVDGVFPWSGLPRGLVLEHNNNYLTFHFAGKTLFQADNVSYRYALEGLDEHWSAVSSKNEATYGNLPPGDFTFRVMAKCGTGEWTHPAEFSFTIRPPIWRTWWAYGFYAVTLVSSFLLFLRWRERSLLSRQRQLEIRVRNATQSLRVQKSEAEKQKDEADQQRELAESQRKIIEQKNRETLDSIEYAKRIQQAILPPQRVLRESLPNSFVLYLPKDIVAGDFYWVESIAETTFFAACDCTGHGVPGALVSVVCNTALTRAVNEFNLKLPGEIFDKVRELIVKNFAKSDEDVKDGMDASLCALDKEKRKLFWSGAHNSLWIYRRQTRIIEQIKADKQTIGKSQNPKPFTTHELNYEDGDVVYLFTDGYADQFGGPRNKKLTRLRFRELIFEIAELSSHEQYHRLIEFHRQYKGLNEQVDDICVFAVVL